MPLCTTLPLLHSRLSSSLLKHKSLLETLQREGRVSDREALRQEEDTLRSIEKEIEGILQEEGLSLYRLTVEEGKEAIKGLRNIRKDKDGNVIKDVAVILDESFEGGMLSYDFSEELIAASTSLSAMEALFQRASTTPYALTDSFKDIASILATSPVLPPSVDALVLNLGRNTEEERSKLVTDMASRGFRPATLQELFAIAISSKNLIEGKNEYLNAYTPLQDESGPPRIPYLNWRGGRRRLSTSDSGDEWAGGDRFLFVRK